LVVDLISTSCWRRPPDRTTVDILSGGWRR
jgi:hypothetical protein